jgi:hypothetical protein
MSRSSVASNGSRQKPSSRDDQDDDAWVSQHARSVPKIDKDDHDRDCRDKDDRGRDGRDKDDHDRDGRDKDHNGRDCRDHESREHARNDSHEKRDSDGKHKSCESDHRGHDPRGDGYSCEVELDQRRDGIDLEIDIDHRGRWLEVDIEIGSLDFELKLDARNLQPDTAPVASLLGGDGVAVGESTLVDANILSRLIDLGSVTVAFGTAKFASTAVSEQDQAFATAMTFADISGADFVFVFNKTESVSSDCGTSYAIESSTTTYIAIDFEEFDFAEGQIAFNFYDALSYLDGCGECGGNSIPSIDGNVSLLTADVQAVGENTLADVLASILTIEGQLSSVSAVGVAAVG